jgi:phospholipid-transporting ATPase
MYWIFNVCVCYLSYILRESAVNVVVIVTRIFLHLHTKNLHHRHTFTNNNSTLSFSADMDLMDALSERIQQVKVYAKTKFSRNKFPTTPRYIPIHDDDEEEEEQQQKKKKDKYPSNLINTGKYNIITFIPRNLFEQFTRMANILFFFIMMLQLVTGLSPTGRYGYLIALTPLVLGQMLKDGLEDLMRHLSDRKTNNQKAFVLDEKAGKFGEKKWKNIHVGDIVQIFSDEMIPADMVVLYTKSSPDSEGKCYVETSQLDGETNLKQKMSLGLTQHRSEDESQLSSLEARIDCDQPSKALYSFNGTFTLIPKKAESEDVLKCPVFYDNLVLRGTRLKNTQYIHGVVVYTGSHTKILMNGRSMPNKRSKVEGMINFMVILLFLFQLLFAVVSAISASALSENSGDFWYMSQLFDRNKNAWKSLYEGVILYFLLFNNFVPIGLLASLEFVKVVYTKIYINADLDMMDVDGSGLGAVANNTQIPEELGQINMVFSDKTGTLTKNIMKFKKFWLPNNERYGKYDTFESKKVKGFWDERVIENNWMRDKHASYFFDMFIILALCHTVTPEIKNNVLEYEASSPDELTLVKYAAEVGFKVIARTENTITIEMFDSETMALRQVQFLIMNVLHFNSDRKRMSVIIRVLDDIGYFRDQLPLGKIFIFSKGADEVVTKRVMKTELVHFLVDDALHDFGAEGLRTLMLAKRELAEEEYYLWNNEHYQPANLATENRQEHIDAAAELIENDMDMAGVTAIEDELQDDVAHTIDQLRKAGIQVYMLTGDKQETAITIGKSCSLINDQMRQITISVESRSNSTPKQNFMKLKDKIEAELLNIERIDQLNNSNLEDNALITNGATLELLFETYADFEIEKMKLKLHATFMQLCLKCKSLICARTSPSQKAKIVQLARKHVKNSRTLSIGDGSNDM